MQQFTAFLLLLSLLTGLALAPASARAAPDDPTIVGGDPVPDPNPFVWQVSLQREGQHNCGGSVIDGQWILTAAHCLVDELQDGAIANLCGPEYLAYLQENIRIIVGVRARSTATADQTFAVAGCAVHPGYDPVLFANDIAVIQLATPIPDAAAYTVPLLLAADEAILAPPNTWATVTGWGTMVPGNGSASPDLLMMLDVPLVEQGACRSAWAKLGVSILDGMVCAGFVNGGQSSCQGDSGGPLVVVDNFGNYWQQGIVSFGPTVCNAAGVPTVYTRVSSYIDWLQQITGLDLTSYRAPDLVVGGLAVVDNKLQVTILNQGTARVALDHGFWVDLYVNPEQEPTQANETWNFVGNFGAVWGMDQTGFVLLPGYSVTLELKDSVYWPTVSHLPLTQIGDEKVFVITPATTFYVQVDSANAQSSYGAILETHELFGADYNNIAGPVSFAQEILIPITSAAAQNNRLYLPLATAPQRSARSTSAAASIVNPLPARPAAFHGE